ncbi:hypothetical protein QM467_08730 [Rhodoblastus sp. 17X3]|uniref:hypothetical protein n=1 Tax=Rhodoblastus sp. 17X3 TaxID=3047026 RepID=UPI0024B639B8|nr:hypothetical protein [Rhodoblastus sp. 17X3]MDI9848133.1 hypothetical protein [Rhodoblastus sp. 17X3]
MKKAFLIASAFALSGCAKPVDQMNYAEIHQLADEIKARCAKQTAPSSPEFDNCTKIEAQYEVNTRNRKRAAAAAALSGVADGMTQAGASYSAAAARPVAPAYSAPVYCNSQTVGPTTQMVCN